MLGLQPKLALALTLAAAPALAADVTVDHAWFRALPAQLPAAGYFRIHNSGKSDVVLTGARSSACGMLMLHQSETMHGMTSMEGVESILVQSGGTLTFAPGGLHLMCNDPKGLLKVGATVPVTLDFEDGRSVSARFVVKNASGR